MGDNEGFEGDPLKKGVSSFSQLLFSPLYNDDSVRGLDLEKKKQQQQQQQGGGIFNPSFSKSENNPKMLCFSENYPSESGVIFTEAVNNVGETHRKSGVTEGGSNCFKALADYPGKRNVSGDVEIDQCVDSCKKIKTGHRNPTSVRRVKVRKEKLGERITALQQLVSTYGKTDTTSLLHEAMGLSNNQPSQTLFLSTKYLA